MPMPELGGIDAMPMRDLSRLQQEKNGGGMGPALMTEFVAEGLAEPAAFGMRPQLQMRDDLICLSGPVIARTVLAFPDLAENLPGLAAFHAEPLLDRGARGAQERIGLQFLFY